MRIFFVTNTYTPYSGGVVQSITALVDALRNQGHEVFVVTLTFLDKHYDPPYVIRIPCPIKFMYKANHMAFAWRAGHMMELLIDQYKPDIIHVHHPFLLGASALNAAKKYNVPCVFTHHTLYAEYTHYIPFVGIYLKKIVTYCVKNFCNKVDAIIAPSSYVKNHLQLQGVIKPIVVIPSPLRECFVKAESYKEEKRDGNFFELLLVTRFVPEKNIPFVLKIMKLLPDHFRLTLVGYGYEAQKLQQLAFDILQLSSMQVCFIHKPEQDELLRLYQLSDLFIFSSLTDTQAIVLAESMSQGLPVIALDGPGQRDIIIDGVNGFIVHSAQEMVEKIIQIAASSLHYKELAAAALRTAKKYEPSVTINKVIDLYSSL